jgi:hydrogenase nickel incorporation protein HypA/HybF
MHEMSITQNILEDVDEHLTNVQYSKIIDIKIKVGELTALDPSSLQFCYDALTKGTKFDGVPLIIDEIPLRGNCNNCKSEINIDNFLFVCSNCGSSDVTIISGEELILSEINIE